MENFVIAKAVGFVLAGILIAIFSDKRALFWGATLVVSAFIGYANPVWGVVTFAELAIGWMIGRWMFTSVRGLSRAVKKQPQALTSPPPQPPPPQPQETLLLIRSIKPPILGSKTPAPPSRKSPAHRPTVTDVMLGVTLAVAILVASVLAIENSKLSPISEQPIQLETGSSIPPQTQVSQEASVTQTARDLQGTELGLIERLAAFVMDGRKVFLALELTSGEYLIGTTPTDGGRALHRLFVIDCRTEAYSRNAESLETSYILEVTKKLIDGEQIMLDPIANGFDDPEASELFRMACGAA